MDQISVSGVDLVEEIDRIADMRQRHADESQEAEPPDSLGLGASRESGSAPARMEWANGVFLPRSGRRMLFVEDPRPLFSGSCVGFRPRRISCQRLQLC